jgi:uncharacterized membrane protein YjdF
MPRPVHLGAGVFPAVIGALVLIRLYQSSRFTSLFYTMIALHAIIFVFILTSHHHLRDDSVR